jgi:hypothetical protein
MMCLNLWELCTDLFYYRLWRFRYKHHPFMPLATSNVARFKPYYFSREQ